MASDSEPKEERELDGQTRAIIAKVYRFLKEEYAFMRENNFPKCDLTPLMNIRKRTAQATGVNEKTVTEILTEAGEGEDSDCSEDETGNKKPRLNDDSSCDCECVSPAFETGTDNVSTDNKELVAIKTEYKIEFDDSNVWEGASNELEHCETIANLKTECEDIPNEALVSSDSVLENLKAEFEDIPIDIKVENVT